MSAIQTAETAILPSKRQNKVISNQVLGMSIFVLTEAMFFTALISAYLVIRAGNLDWIPPGTVRLPIYATGFNTVMLILSGVFSYKSYKKFITNDMQGSLKLFAWTIFFASFFVVIQGAEWVRLINYGMTLKSGVFSSTFYLLIGTHGLHAISAVLAMVAIFRRIKIGQFSSSSFHAFHIYWFFIIGLWPVLFRLVYF